MKVGRQENGNFRAGMMPHSRVSVEDFGKAPIDAPAPTRSDLLIMGKDYHLSGEGRRKLLHHLAYCLERATGGGRKYLGLATSFLSG